MALNFNVSNLSIAQLEQQKAICDQRIHQLETLTVQLLPYKHLDSHKQLWNQTQQQLFTLKYTGMLLSIDCWSSYNGRFR